MTGIFADNQPDFTWLDAYEEKLSRSSISCLIILWHGANASAMR